jgi:GNAT superfamily N-acetyltransferase
MIEAQDEPRIALIEAAADQLLVEQFGPELFTEVTPGKDRVVDPGFVLVVGRPCVGFAHVLEERGTAHLQQLAVDPAHGRRGLGTALVNACCEEARLRGASQLSLTTFRDLPFNAPWYARLGFVIIDQPDGVVARHVQQEQPYGRLAPRVAMGRPLSTPAGPRCADVTGDQ